MSHFLNLHSFNAHKRHEDLFIIQLTGQKNFIAEGVIKELSKFHKEVPLLYYTCKCFSGVNIWYFAYKTQEEQDRVALVIKTTIARISQKLPPEMGEMPTILRDLTLAYAKPCVCPFTTKEE